VRDAEGFSCLYPSTISVSDLRSCSHLGATTTTLLRTGYEACDGRSDAGRTMPEYTGQDNGTLRVTIGEAAARSVYAAIAVPVVFQQRPLATSLTLFVLIINLAMTSASCTASMVRIRCKRSWGRTRRYSSNGLTTGKGCSGAVRTSTADVSLYDLVNSETDLAHVA
jgi:hypothetical protein